jgi:branched-chain amino acid transport system ATP-binding protein
LSFELRRGELGVLLAPNGWGKTTLLEAIAGLLPVSSGKIELNGQEIQRLPIWERVQSGINFLQSRENYFPNLTVEEFIRLSNVTLPSEIVNRLGGKQMSFLSGGEKQKVINTVTLYRNNFKLGIFDEPFSALDKRAVNHFQDSLLKYYRQSIFLLLLPSNI